MASSVRAQRRWLRRLSAVFLLLMLFVMGVLGAVLTSGLKTLDEVDYKNDVAIVHSLLHDRQTSFHKLLTDYAEWNDAYRNLHEQQNRTFADENLAFNLTTNYGVSIAAVVGPDGSVWTKYRDGLAIAGAWSPPPEVIEVVDALKSQQGQIAPTDSPRGLTTLTLIDGKLYMVGVNFIAAVDEKTGVLPLPDRPSILLLARPVDDTVLTGWGQVFQLQDMSFTRDALPPDSGRPNTTIADYKGRTLGSMQWQSDQSRALVQQQILPGVLGVLLAMLLLGALYFWLLGRVGAQQALVMLQVDKNRQFLKLIFDSDPTLIQVRDKEGRIFFANKAAAARYGYAPEQVENSILFDIDRDVTRARQNYEDDLRSIVTNREHIRQEIWEGEGGQRIFTTLRRPFVSLNNETMVLVIATDITDQHHTIQDLADAKQRAETAARAKSEFLTIMSHEIRTPMNGILGFSQLLQQGALSDEQRQYISIIQNSSRSLLAILNDVLDMSKIESGKLRLENAPFDPAAVLESVLAVIRPQAAEKNILLTSALSGPVIPKVTGDASRLGQVLLNLLGNAVKFTEHGSVQVRLQTMLAARSINLRFEVQDTGIGIAPADRAKIFEKFSQADTTISRKHGGTGLGLSIAKELVTLMGGQIGVESTPNQGSIFWFTIALDPVA